MNTLHFNLKKKWFDMILSGEKKEEYRVIKDYWVGRLVDPNSCKEAKEVLSGQYVRFKYFDSITFSNGYARDRRQFEIKIERIRIGFGKLPWGAESRKKYFAFVLGDVIKSNCQDS